MIDTNNKTCTLKCKCPVKPLCCVTYIVPLVKINYKDEATWVIYRTEL